MIYRLLPGVILALIALADVRWAAYAGLLLWGYALWPDTPGRSYWRSLRQRVAGLLINSLLALALAAPVLLPLAELTQLTTRANLQAGESLVHSLPAARLLGLFFPYLGDFHEWVLYPGAVALLLAVAALIGGAGRRATFWAAAAGVAFLFALGEQIPGMSALAGLPGFDLLRVPPRLLFAAGLALIALAAHGAARLCSALPRRRRYWLNLALSGLAGFSLLLAGGAWVVSGGQSAGFWWGAAALALSAAWIGLRLAGRVPAGAWLVGLALLGAVDWAYMDRSLVTSRPAQEVEAEGRALAEYLAGQAGLFRVYAPTHSLPQSSAAAYGIELANGVDPLQLQAYAGFMEQAGGYAEASYGVVLPPVERAPGEPDARLLGLLNVRYLVVDGEFRIANKDEAPGSSGYPEEWVWVKKFTREELGLNKGLMDGRNISENWDVNVYENRLALPRAWLQTPGAPLGDGAQAVEILRWTPNRIDIAIPPGEGGAERLLVLSELAYPGWRVTVAGRPAEMLAPGGLLRGVLLSGEAAQVSFVFTPTSLYLGLALAGAGLAMAGWLNVEQVANLFKRWPARSMAGGRV